MSILSVITTVYNAEEFIDESLQSLVEQKFKDFELILVNDGCTDGTRNKLINFYNNSPLKSIKFLENQYNIGVPISRNRAILQAKGDFIAIHDADDISLPSRFQKQIEIMNNNTAMAVVGGHAIKIDEKGEEIGSINYPAVSAKEMIEILLTKLLNPFVDPTTIFRKDVFLRVGGYNTKPQLQTVQDLDLWCRLLVQREMLTNIQEPLIKYRINHKGVTKSRQQEMMSATKFLRDMFIRGHVVKSILQPKMFQNPCFTEYQLPKD